MPRYVWGSLADSGLSMIALDGFIGVEDASTFPRRLFGPRSCGSGMHQERAQVLVAPLEQRKLRVFGLLMRLRRQARPEVRRRHPALGEAGYVRPRLLGPHL